jgi:hypothetical protein
VIIIWESAKTGLADSSHDLLTRVTYSCTWLQHLGFLLTPIHNSSLLGRYALLLPRHCHSDSLLSPWRTQTKTLARQGPQTQDFRFVDSIINASNLAESTPIPKRSEEAFEPNAAKAQPSALGPGRLPQCNAHCALTPHACTKSRFTSWRSTVLKELGVEAPAHRPYSRAIGKGDSKSRIWLLPEEALYLIERGNLDLRWPDLPSVGDEDRNDIEGQGSGDDPFGRTAHESPRRICKLHW